MVKVPTVFAMHVLAQFNPNEPNIRKFCRGYCVANYEVKQVNLHGNVVAVVINQKFLLNLQFVILKLRILATSIS